jgi:hypothetical protein
MASAWETIDNGAKGCLDSLDGTQINEAIGSTELAIHTAEVSGLFDSHRRTLKALNEARILVKKLGEAVSTMDSTCRNWRSIREMYRAVQVLRERAVIEKQPLKAAAAFGDLISNLGELASQLPPPGPHYGRQLKQFDRNFFVKTCSNASFDLRPNNQEGLNTLRSIGELPY